MILADFKIRPLPGSKYSFRVRVWKHQSEMERAAVAEGSMTGEAQACFNGFRGPDEIKGGVIGVVYLYESPSIWADATHELTHAAAHYVREIRHGDLAEPNNGEYASNAEELLCRTAEHMVVKTFERLARFKNAPRKPAGPVPPAGYSAEELERDNPYNAWVYEGA